MTDAHETKYQEMQKYVPFIQRVIEKLKVNNEHQADNPRKAQLQKMEMLYDLLTNKHKKIKIETLIKCEGVLIKLKAKIEKNEDLILSDLKLKEQTSCKTTLTTKVQEVEDILGPASPPPEVIPDDIEQPVVIPTERRCSPILVKETVKSPANKLLQHKRETPDYYRRQHSQHATSEDFQSLRKKAFHLDSNAGNHHPSQDKSALPQQRPQYDSSTSSPKNYQHAKESQHPKHFNPSRHSSSLPGKEKNSEAHKSPAPGQKLQTVKVVITEPLPAHFKKQHFASYNIPRSSVCHNNLKTLPQATKTKEDNNEAYSPEELWDKYSESHNKRSSPKTTSTPPVFSRLGVKVPENSSPSCSTSKPSGRYTPIPDVLKSPPLSVSDINNLLLESGAEKLNDISEIGTRRPVKNDDHQKQSPNNSFEYVRKKLAQTAKISSAHSETPKLHTDKNALNISPLPQERIALKYNPHPRHERLQSVSSTDGSECSTQSKINDPRIKLKLQTGSSLHSPTQMPASNVNVLPAINLSDPRLKKQNILPVPPETKSSPSTAPKFSSTRNMGLFNQNAVSNYGSRRKDPRISRIPNNTSPIQPMPIRILNTSQPQYSSEENWDSDEDETKRPPIKTFTPVAKNDQHKVESSVGAREEISFVSNSSDIRNKRPDERTSINQSRSQFETIADNIPLIGSEKEPFVNKQYSETNVNAKQVPQKEHNLNKQNVQKDTPSGSKKSKNKLIPSTTFVVSNPPKSDTEEDWDSEDETKNDDKPKVLKADVPQLPINKSPVAPMIAISLATDVPQLPINKSSGVGMVGKGLTADVPQLPVNKSPVVPAPMIGKSLTTDVPQLHINKSPIVPMIAPYHTQISTKALINPISLNTASMPPIHMAQIPIPQLRYPMVGSNNHHYTHQMYNSAANNRFNSILNDKSERIKYFEAKKQKALEPRTYKEFREAKERAQAQEAALKRAADEAEAKKRAEEFKEAHKGKEIKENIFNKKVQQMDTFIKIEEDKKLNKLNHKDNKKPPVPVESTLDKMYRTQNFNSKFPKANTSFKIPKKKTEENSKEEASNLNEASVEQTGILSSDKADKLKSNQTEPFTDKTKSFDQELNNKGNNSNNDIKGNHTESSFTSKQLETNIGDKAEVKQDLSQLSKEDLTEKSFTNKKPKNNATDDMFENQKTEDTSNKQNEKENEQQKELADDNKTKARDPRCRIKSTSVATEEIKEKKGVEVEVEKETDLEHKQKQEHENNFKLFGEIVITSSESHVVLRPQQNLDKFNKFTQELAPKPQRILRRRNTMVVFDSAPLVDKDKLKKANALLFEDLQEEEKRKRKQTEEDRLIARRNKHLEEMFKKTDDNCTVSTQNIITGKRRTRATINFNETVNAINVFKHTTMKDSSPGNIVATPSATQAIKPIRTNFKIKIKNLDISGRKDKSDEDEYENLDAVARKETKTKEPFKITKTKCSMKDANKPKETDTEDKSNAKVPKKRSSANKKLSSNLAEEDAQTVTANIEVNFKPIRNDEHQNCAVSSTSTDNCNIEEATSSSISTNISLKKESDDNEPTSTATKSNNPTPTPESHKHVLNEIVDQILKPNADREHILGVLGQILSEERLELIKSLIERCNKQNEEQETIKDDADKQNAVEESNEGMNVDKAKTSSKNKQDLNNKEDKYEEEEQDEQKPLKPNKAVGGKKMTLPKKKRSELDRLNEDIRDMFICEGVLTATGRRMCTIMGKDVEPAGNKKSTKESTPSPISEQESTNKRKEEMLKPPAQTRSLRRSIRCCKTIEDNDDDESQSTHSRTTDESIDDFNTTTDNSTATDITPQRKMPVLKPHTPIKIPEEELPKARKTKEPVSKRKSDTKSGLKSKKFKIQNDESKEDSESEAKESETEADEVEVKGAEELEATNKKEKIIIKNTNVHWHNQSKYTTWCMICEKKILTNLSSMHYKTHHRENYISRMAPVLLQQFKQGKLNHPLFGVKRAQRQPSWFYRCPFCIKYFNTPMPLWLEHFINHTVELRYECSKCHRCSNRKKTVSRHIKSCEGATIITSAVKLIVPTVINAHVCHLCNFIQLKRGNLERHYIEQHQLDRKTVDLLGYTIKLFDVENVECVAEENAAERENEAWQLIEKDEQIIDIDDDEDSSPIPIHNFTTQIEDAADSNQEGKENERERSVGPENKEKATSNNENEKSQRNECSIDLQQTKDIGDKKNEIETNTIQTNNFDKVANLLNQQDQDERTQEKGATNADPTQTNKLKSVKISKQTVEEDEPEKLELQSDKKSRQKDVKKSIPVVEKRIKSKNFPTKAKNKKSKKVLCLDLTESESNNDFEVIKEKESVQDIQDELLALAARAAEREDENQKQQEMSRSNIDTHTSLTNAKKNESENENETTKKSSISNQKVANETAKLTTNNSLTGKTQTTISDIISNSIDMIFNRVCCDSTNNDKSKTIGLEPSEVKKVCLTPSNVFMPTRDESNSSPTIQILAQSIINIEEEGNASVKEKPITMAERLSQRFKGLQNEDTSNQKSNITNQSTSNSTNKSCKENAFEKLINDTLFELTKATDRPSNQTLAEKTPITEPHKENVFERLFSETVLEFQNDKENESVSQEMQQTTTAANLSKDVPNTTDITVISDDEDWEDIEITETAPITSATSAGNLQKTKNKGLFQKFGIFKGNNTKSKKHLPPMVYLPKKKTKEKSSQPTTLPPSPITTTTTDAITKLNETTTTNSLGFKPLINIMDGLFPDSPCNDPIDLVPELAPLEPLQDLNDISSILDSNLSAVNINAADNHTSIEDALDFISEQQANDKQQNSNIIALNSLPGQAKTTINNISHVGFSVQTAGENSFKFYCLLQNCSFLYSSDSMGLETHFIYEHSQTKWNGYCLMCQSQCFPNADASQEHSISKEISHMMEKHANKGALDVNTDSTQHSTTSSQDNEERPKIKLRRLTGDCLSRATPENVIASNDITSSDTTTNATSSMSMLGALLVAEPKPPTKEMPPQPQMPLTEPLLLDNTTGDSPQLSFRNVNSDFLITSVTSTASKANQTPLQISNVISLNKPIPPATTCESGQTQIPKISNVRTLAPKKAGSLWSQQIEKEHLELVEAAEESIEVSRILQNAGRPSTNREVPRSVNDSPVVVAETVPLAQSKTGDFVVTQTVSAQYNEFSSAALGFNISIAASTTCDNTNPETVSTVSNSASIPSRQYKCMGIGCKFVSRVPVAMSDHLRFHERRNFSNKRDYLSCGFCFYCASDVEDYIKHANQFHIINKGGTAPNAITPSNETDTATSLTKKIQNILNSSSGTSGGHSSYSVQSQQQNDTTQVQDTEEAYLKKLRETIDEIVGPTGLSDDKLYRCVIKNCHTQLTEATFLSHIMFHITTTGGNPNNYLFKCPHCAAQYHRTAGIKAHIKNHARNRFFCYLCDETSTNPGQLLKHFSEKHWHTLNMYTKELLQPKISTDGSEMVIDSSYFVAYTQDLSIEEVRKFGEKLILEWQRKKSGSKTHFKSTEIDLLPLSAIFQREVNCGECEYKTKVRTNMFRHLLMHKQNPGSANKSGVSNVCSVDPVNPVPCLNSTERFFDKMTNLASSSVIPSSGGGSSTTKSSFKIPYGFVEETKRYTCGCQSCNFCAISEDLFRTHLSALHNTAMTYCCTFCQEEICKRGITIDRIINHTRFHGSTIYRCEECNYVHHMRYVVERHVNERHATMKVNIVTHNRSSENSAEGSTTVMPFTGKKYKETVEINQTAQTSSASTRSTSSESSGPKPITYVNSAKSKGKWLCDMCAHRASTVSQMQTHCQQQHGVKNQYKCAHCNFGSQQLSQILYHIDEKHSGKTREARCMYHKTVNSGDDIADTRPLWQRNDPTRIRHIRGILMEDEEESEEYQKNLDLADDVDDVSNEYQHVDVGENDEELNPMTYISGYEFGCYHCSFKTQTFEDLKNQHYAQIHNSKLETAKPFWYRLQRRLCCPECRSFLGNYSELQQHLQNTHKKSRFYASDIRMAENDDTSHRILCGYCSFHCVNAEQLYKHHLRVQHWPQDIRIDNDEQIMEVLALGKAEVSYQCTLCADIFSNRVSIVQHACYSHPGEDSFSFRELTNSLLYRCNSCCFTSTTEIELLRHSIEHYSPFKVCCFCREPQSSFTVYMQHCYAEHRNDIQKFRTIYSLTEIKKFLLQTLIIFPSGLVLNKRNLLNTKYGSDICIEELYEDIYKISQQPPIPRLSIARLVARKSIEAQQKNVETPSTSLQGEILDAMQPRSKSISKRQRTLEDQHSNDNSQIKPKFSIVEGKRPATIAKRRTTVDHDQQQQLQQKDNEFNAPLQLNKICKRRRTVAVDRETLFSSSLISSTNSLLIKTEASGKKRKSSYIPANTPSPKHVKETYPLNLDIEPFSFYGQMPETSDLTKIYTKVAIGGIKTPLTIDKFRLLFNIDCQLKLTKCDESQLMVYNDYKHIKKACPASHKLKFYR